MRHDNDILPQMKFFNICYPLNACKCRETDLNKSGTYFCIPFKCNVMSCVYKLFLYLNKTLFTLSVPQGKAIEIMCDFLEHSLKL